MIKLFQLRKLHKQFSTIGKEENFTNYCFRYGKITADYRDENIREVFFDIDGTKARVIIERGVTILATLKIK